LKRTREDVVVFNQFEEFGNYLWHHEVTGSAMEEVLAEIMKPEDKYFGVSLTSGSAGTLGSGDYLKKIFPQSKIAFARLNNARPSFTTGSAITGSKA